MEKIRVAARSVVQPSAETAEYRYTGAGSHPHADLLALLEQPPPHAPEPAPRIANAVRRGVQLHRLQQRDDARLAETSPRSTRDWTSIACSSEKTAGASYGDRPTYLLARKTRVASDV